MVIISKDERDKIFNLLQKCDFNAPNDIEIDDHYTLIVAKKLAHLGGGF